MYDLKRIILGRKHIFGSQVFWGKCIDWNYSFLHILNNYPVKPLFLVFTLTGYFKLCFQVINTYEAQFQFLMLSVLISHLLKEICSKFSS
jgi:hypothetical protein